MSGYVSKDYIHEGCGLILNPEKVWDFVPYSVRKNIKKAKSANVKVVKAEGTADDFKILSDMWYKPDDPNLPSKLNNNDYMYIAYNSENEPIGAVVLLTVGNHLFLNNLAGNQKGKELRVQDYLLWHCVNELKDSGYKYIDVGVSFRASLYDFFKKWKTFSYPVIFNVPEIRIDIGLKPFDNQHYIAKSDEAEINRTISKLKEIIKSEKFTFLPNIQIAKDLITKNDCVPIDQTFNFPYNETDNVYFIDLTKIFSVQFGTLLVNMKFDDKTLWNDYRVLDVYKREITFTSLAAEISDLDNLITKRKQNYNILKNYFLQENINPVEKDEKIKSAFYFIHENNFKFSNKLTDFGISHYFNKDNFEIGLPIHQNLTPESLEYLYAIFRGVLNLCSEWIHTDYYNDIK